MKCLYITPFKPSLKSGGEITVFNNLTILSKIVDSIDYIGLEFEKNIFQNNVNIVKNYYLHNNNNNTLQDKIISFFKFYDSVSSFSFLIMKILNKLELEKYDFIFIESTRFGSLVKYISQFNKNIIVNMHNIELNYFKDARNILKYLLIKQKIFYSEYNSFIYSKYILYLTNYEFNNMKEIYLIENNKFIWNPVTYKDMENIRYKAKNRDYILFTGNFNYQPNIEAVKILNKIKDRNIIIAGRSTKKLYTQITNKKIKLVEFPSDEEMNNLMRNARIFLSTVKDGAGMKVKIIEAMAYGLPIVAHKNSLNGYEKVNSICSYKNDEEMLQMIENLDDTQLNLMGQNSLKYFNEYYSYKSVIKRYKELLT